MDINIDQINVLLIYIYIYIYIYIIIIIIIIDLMLGNHLMYQCINIVGSVQIELA
jgi:hypothetical protein